MVSLIKKIKTRAGLAVALLLSVSMGIKPAAASSMLDYALQVALIAQISQVIMLSDAIYTGDTTGDCILESISDHDSIPPYIYQFIGQRLIDCVEGTEECGRFCDISGDGTCNKYDVYYAALISAGEMPLQNWMLCNQPTERYYDINRDGLLNYADMRSIFSKLYTEDCDFDGDRFCGVTDLAEVLGHFQSVGIDLSYDPAEVTYPDFVSNSLSPFESVGEALTPQ